MPTNGESVKPSLREVLADSHIAAVAVTVLLFWSIYHAARILLGLLIETTVYLVTAVAIRDFPYPSLSDELTSQFWLLTMLADLCLALIYLAAAWLLSRWTYGVGPLHTLGKCRNSLARRNNV